MPVFILIFCACTMLPQRIQIRQIVIIFFIIIY